MPIAMQLGEQPMWSPLITMQVNSARVGNLNSVERILKMGADVDSLDPENVCILKMRAFTLTVHDSLSTQELWTPLMWACKNSHLEVVRLLLQYNPNVNAAAAANMKEVQCTGSDVHH